VKEEAFEYEAQLPWLLGVFSVRFENTGDQHRGRKKIIVVWTRWLTGIKMVKFTFALNSLACTVHLECHLT